MIRPDNIDATLAAEYGVVIPMRERPKLTREWVEREQELLTEIDTLRRIAGDQETKITRMSWAQEELDAAANTRVAELEAKLFNWRLAVIAMGSVGATVIAGFVL